MQGLIGEKERDYSRRTGKIKKLLEENQNNYKRSNRIIVETINVIKPNLDSAQREYLTPHFIIHCWIFFFFSFVHKHYIVKIYAALDLIIKSQNKRSNTRL